MKKLTNFYVVLFSGACCLFVTLPSLAQSAMAGKSGPTLLVANQADQDLSLIDPVTAQQVATIPEGGITGHEVAVYPAGHIAFVPIYGNSGVGKPGTDGQIIDIIDIPSRKVVSKIDFGHGVRPHCAIYEPVSGLLYVTTELDKSVSIIDPRSLKVVGSIPTSQTESHMLAISHDGLRGYTANVGPGTVSVLDMKARKTLTVIPISSQTQRISISKDDSMVFTSDQSKPQLAVIDTRTNKVKSWVPLPGLGYGTASTNDGRSLLITIPTLNEICVLDLATMKITHSIEVGKHPTEILVRPDGRTAYVSSPDGKVAAIDVAQWKVQSLIDAGKGADGLAWAK
ncbi:YncE family protein [Acidicapsa ligni]|uniref:YncE family protein n=1 Tax=Acidicapsa ligni TaxID=542300 RepID=UPI0021E0D2BB|nr:YncE family protein [Acidicapsa ligni]